MSANKSAKTTRSKGISGRTSDAECGTKQNPIQPDSANEDEDELTSVTTETKRKRDVRKKKLMKAVIEKEEEIESILSESEDDVKVTKVNANAVEPSRPIRHLKTASNAFGGKMKAMKKSVDVDTLHFFFSDDSDGSDKKKENTREGITKDGHNKIVLKPLVCRGASNLSPLAPSSKKSKPVFSSNKELGMTPDDVITKPHKSSDVVCETSAKKVLIRKPNATKRPCAVSMDTRQPKRMCKVQDVEQKHISDIYTIDDDSDSAKPGVDLRSTFYKKPMTFNAIDVDDDETQDISEQEEKPPPASPAQGPPPGTEDYPYDVFSETNKHRKLLSGDKGLFQHDDSKVLKTCPICEDEPCAPAVPLKNKRRLSQNLEDPSPYFRPYGKDVKTIILHFSSNGRKLREHQCSSRQKVPWGERVTAGSHCSNTLFRKKQEERKREDRKREERKREERKRDERKEVTATKAGDDFFNDEGNYNFRHHPTRIQKKMPYPKQIFDDLFEEHSDDLPDLRKEDQARMTRLGLSKNDHVKRPKRTVTTDVNSTGPTRAEMPSSEIVKLKKTNYGELGTFNLTDDNENEDIGKEISRTETRLGSQSPKAGTSTADCSDLVMFTDAQIGVRSLDDERKGKKSPLSDLESNEGNWLGTRGNADPYGQNLTPNKQSPEPSDTCPICHEDVPMRSLEIHVNECLTKQESVSRRTRGNNEFEENTSETNLVKNALTRRPLHLAKPEAGRRKDMFAKRQPESVIMLTDSEDEVAPSAPNKPSPFKQTRTEHMKSKVKPRLIDKSPQKSSLRTDSLNVPIYTPGQAVKLRRQDSSDSDRKVKMVDHTDYISESGLAATSADELRRHYSDLPRQGSNTASHEQRNKTVDVSPDPDFI